VGFSGDGHAAASAELNDPIAVTVDASGNLFIADAGNNRIREVHHATGIINTVAGNGAPGYSGERQPATRAKLDFPLGLAVDSAGDLFIANASNDRVQVVNHATGLITSVAGNGTAGYSGDGHAATSAQLDYPSGLAVDAAGDLFIADSLNNVVREVRSSRHVARPLPKNTPHATLSHGV
jgi:hypothetical protein